MMYAYRLGALKVESDLDLPDLLPWDAPGDSKPDIVIQRGKVPSQLPQADRVEAIFQTRGRDEYLLDLPGTGRILIRYGREIVIDAEDGADPINTRALLTGSAQAVLWHQRGLLPLQANAVVIGGRAVALAGASAAGKSALTAVLAQAGHQILADGICVVTSNGKSGSPIVLPGVTVLRLWRDTLDQLGIAANGLRATLSGRDRFVVDDGPKCDEGRPLAAVVVMVRRSTVALAIERLSGAAAFGFLRANVHMSRVAHALGRDPQVFAALTQVLSAGVAVWRLMLPDDPTCLGDAGGKVLEALEQT
jgi:hypothetical protein